MVEKEAFGNWNYPLCGDKVRKSTGNRAVSLRKACSARRQRKGIHSYEIDSDHARYCGGAPGRLERRAAIYDAIQFGEPGSEKSHGLESDDSEVIRGGLDEPARILLPRAPASWQGGSVKFKLRVNPNRQNYVTLKLWGGDVNENLLILHADGRQVGYRSRGDIGLLDYGSPEPAVPGRFYYVTLPLPMSATYRRERVEFEIVSTGRIWEPGRTFEQYQKKMLTPSRGLYRFYVHDHSYFKPPAEDRQGARPEPVLPPQQPESFEALKERVNRELDRLLGPDGRFTNQMQLLMAAEAAGLEWSRACRNPEAVRRIVAGLDNCYLRWREDPSLASDDRSAVYPAWTGFGPAAEAVRLLHKDLGPYLDEELRGPDRAAGPAPQGVGRYA